MMGALQRHAFFRTASLALAILHSNHVLTCGLSFVYYLQRMTLYIIQRVYVYPIESPKMGPGAVIGD